MITSSNCPRVLTLVAFALSIGAGVGLADGWRHDGSGRYAGAEPVLQWSKTNNIVWSQAAGDWSNASPLPVGNRLLIQSERAMLHCLDAATGSNLWSRTNDYSQVMTTEALAELRRAEALQSRVMDATRRMQADPANLLLYSQMSDLCREVLADPRNTNAFASIKQFSLPPTHGDTGFSTPTPFSDGKSVFMLTALGTAARYDLEGKRVWIRMLRKPSRGWGQSASPVLADGKLLAQIDDMLYALSPETGETVWTFKGGASFGSPVVIKVGDATFVHTTGGDLVRLSDGTCAASKLAGTPYSSPIADGDCIYAVDENGGVAFRLSPGPSNTVTAAKLWEAKPNRNRYYASPVLDNGLLYAINAGGVLSALDVKDGAIVYEKKLELSGTFYPSLCLAGGKLFASSDNGTTVIFEPGREFREVARNNLGEGFRSTPCFVGNRILIRGMRKVYCIGN
ncbi:MAG: PQQ-binding-like beta-propeller repeat protein [Kiritimatiellia bacterium]